MPDFLTRWNGTWHFVRRVPVEFAALDQRGVVKHSTRVRVSAGRGRDQRKDCQQVYRPVGPHAERNEY